MNKDICRQCWDVRSFGEWGKQDWDEPKSVWQCWHTKNRDDWRHPCIWETDEPPLDCLYRAEHIVSQEC